MSVAQVYVCREYILHLVSRSSTEVLSTYSVQRSSMSASNYVRADSSRRKGSDDSSSSRTPVALHLPGPPKSRPPYVRGENGELVPHPRYGPAKRGRLLKRGDSIDESSTHQKDPALASIWSRRVSEDVDYRNSSDTVQSPLTPTDSTNLQFRSKKHSRHPLSPDQPSVVVRPKAQGPVPLLPLSMLREEQGYDKSTAINESRRAFASAPTTPLDNKAHTHFKVPVQKQYGTVRKNSNEMNEVHQRQRQRSLQEIIRVPTPPPTDFASVLHVGTTVHVQHPDSVHWDWPETPFDPHTGKDFRMAENLPVMDAVPPPAPDTLPTFTERLSPPGSKLPRRPSVTGDVETVPVDCALNLDKSAKNALLEIIRRVYPQEKLVFMTRKYYAYDSETVVTDREIDAVICKRFALFESEFIPGMFILCEQDDD